MRHQNRKGFGVGTEDGMLLKSSVPQYFKQVGYATLPSEGSVLRLNSGEVGVQSNQIIVLATRNGGKTLEIEGLLRGFPVIIKSLNDFGPIPAIEEDGETFDDNAYKKASLTARYLGLPALADDSGLVVDALNGAPGVMSARYGGPDATDEERCQKLLAAMAGQTERAAHFACVLSLAVPSGAALTYEARCDGVINESPLGTNGFGYDPIFLYPPLQKTFAQMSLDEKNKISHRAQALLELRAEFDKVLVWIRNHLPSPPFTGCVGGGAENDG